MTNAAENVLFIVFFDFKVISNGKYIYHDFGFEISDTYDKCNHDDFKSSKYVDIHTLK